MEEKLTEAEYAARMARLQQDAEDARKTPSRAQSVFDGIREEMTALRRAWREQQGGAR